MTITNTHELLQTEARTDKQRQIFSVAALMVNKCGDIIPKNARRHLFPFAANILLCASKIEAFITDTSPESAETDLKGSTTLAALEQDAEEDLQVDEASQALLGRYCVGFSTAVVESARKGEQIVREVTTYGLQIGEAALEIVRIRPISEPSEPITYTLNAAASPDD